MTPSYHQPAASSPPTNSAAEVREFLQHVKEKDPQEILGADKQSSLGVAMLQATVLTVVIMVAWTAGSYLWSQVAAASGKPAAVKTAEPEGKAEPAEPVKAPTTAATAAPAPDKGKTTTVSKETADKLGVNDTKVAPAKVNPLDKSADDLFKDLDKK